MTTTKAKPLAATLAAAVLVILLGTKPTEAHAAMAFLVQCRAETSVTGRFIYVGTYNYAGQLFERAFSQYCPQTIEVY